VCRDSPFRVGEVTAHSRAVRHSLEVPFSEVASESPDSRGTRRDGPFSNAGPGYRRRRRIGPFLNGNLSCRVGEVGKLQALRETVAPVLTSRHRNRPKCSADHPYAAQVTDFRHSR
jgi:hypothetical protein